MGKPANYSKYIGRKVIYRGSELQVLEYDNGWAKKSPQFWCRVLDDKNKHFKKGEEFTLSSNTIRTIFRKVDGNG